MGNVRVFIQMGLIALLTGWGLESFGRVVYKTAAQESSPKYFRDEKSEKITGYCSDILKALVDVDPDIRIEGAGRFFPFPRIQKN